MCYVSTSILYVYDVIVFQISQNFLLAQLNLNEIVYIMMMTFPTRTFHICDMAPQNEWKVDFTGADIYAL